MSGFNVSELNQLVQNGIQTVEFLQQGKENIQKTYGRSAIQQPNTRTRIAAWESINPGNDNTSSQSSGSKRTEEGRDPDESTGDTGHDGEHGAEPRSDGVFSKTGEKTTDKQVWNAAYTDRDLSGVGGAAASGLQQTGARGYLVPGGDADTEGDHSDGGVNVGDYKQVMIMDHEMSSAETQGETSSGAKIRNATTDDFATVFEEGTPKIHRRLRGITAAVTSPLPSTPGSGPVKKGTDENTASTLLGDVQLSGSGAIPNVHPSLLHQPSQNAHAENAQGCVPDVSETGFTCKSDEAPYNSEKTEGKIDLLVREIENVSKKLDYLPEIKEEIKNINKKITNLSLGLSTVENYIKSMMIIIPGSGKESGSSSAEVNPDLKAVIGRDKTRGLKELTTQRSDLESLDGSGYYPQSIDEKYLTRALDFNKSNAANFKPLDDTGSFYTIVSMIKNEVDDVKKQNELITWATQAVENTATSDLYDIIREALDDYSESKANDE